MPAKVDLPKLLPPNDIKSKWLRVADFPKGKKLSKHLFVTEHCWHRVDERDDMERRAAKFAQAFMRFTDRIIKIERALLSRTGILQHSILAPIRARAFNNYLLAMSKAHVLRPHSIQVALVKDHPFKAVLDALPHVPKSVKSLYRGDVRLAHFRAVSGWHVFEAMNNADQAWANYLENSKPTP